MKHSSLGSFVTVRVWSRDVAAFNSKWPCAGIPERACWFQFDYRNGDLVDMSPHLYSDKFEGDGNALAALSHDAQAFASTVYPNLKR